MSVCVLCCVLYCAYTIRCSPGSVEFDRLRPLSYTQTDVFMLCFSVVDPLSFDHLRTKWAPEVKFHCPNCPIVVVGTMVDLRYDKSVVARLAERNQVPIETAVAQEMADELGARLYVECSAFTQAGLAAAIEGTAMAVLPDAKVAQEAAQRQTKMEGANAPDELVEPPIIQPSSTAASTSPPPTVSRQPEEQPLNPSSGGSGVSGQGEAGTDNARQPKDQRSNQRYSDRSGAGAEVENEWDEDERASHATKGCNCVIM